MDLLRSRAHARHQHGEEVAYRRVAQDMACETGDRYEVIWSTDRGIRQWRWFVTEAASSGDPLLPPVLGDERGGRALTRWGARRAAWQALNADASGRALALAVQRQRLRARTRVKLRAYEIGMALSYGVSVSGMVGFLVFALRLHADVWTLVDFAALGYAAFHLGLILSRSADGLRLNPRPEQLRRAS